jgi:predicted DCC family thiol-disulfide oxidoreductase YuxK
MLATFIHHAPRANQAGTSSMARGFVLYDGRCRMCRTGVRLFARPLRQRGFDAQPLQRRWVGQRLNTQREQLGSRMWVITKDGGLLGGAEAVLHLCQFMWWTWPLHMIAGVPGGTCLIDQMYRFIASWRSCDEEMCSIDRRTLHNRWRDWIPLIALPTIALASGWFMPRWLWMWALAYSLFAGCKWLTWQRAIRAQRHVSIGRSIGYLFAWPGMNWREFFSRKIRTNGGTGHEWAAAWLKTITGAVILWIGCRFALRIDSLMAGWVGMIGMVTVLHFGAFHLLSLAWRRAGINAPHLFRNPVAASSVGEFWGRRWNLGFRTLSHEFVFAPLHERIGATGAMAITFLVSGLIHDFVISVPAGGGYGLPTAYFMLQALGVMMERSRVGARFGLRRGIGGRAWLCIVTAAPAFVLFHPPFVERVILPFLEQIGAL